MISREKAIEGIAKVPDENLHELYKVIKDFEMKKENGQSGESVMARLRKIKISASPDFSTKANLYEIEADNAK